MKYEPDMLDGESMESKIGGGVGAIYREDEITFVNSFSLKFL
jgi:hypothetical protein